MEIAVMRSMPFRTSLAQLGHDVAESVLDPLWRMQFFAGVPFTPMASHSKHNVSCYNLVRIHIDLRLQSCFNQFLFGEPFLISFSLSSLCVEKIQMLSAD